MKKHWFKWDTGFFITTDRTLTEQNAYKHIFISVMGEPG